MQKLTNYQLNELCCFLSAIEKICKSDYAHIADLDTVKKIIQLVDSNYKKADNILTERENATN